MEVNGTVVSIDVDVQVAKNGGGTYPGSRLTYRDESGAIKEKAFHSNVFKFNAALKGQLTSLSVGQAFIMDMEKQGEFWNVKSIKPTTELTHSKTEGVVKATPSPKSTYETPEERAKKQVYIVRQSALNQAIAFSEIAVQLDKKFVFNVDEVVSLAKRFENYVLDLGFDNFKDDSAEVL